MESCSQTRAALPGQSWKRGPIPISWKSPASFWQSFLKKYHAEWLEDETLSGSMLCKSCAQRDANSIKLLHRLGRSSTDSVDPTSGGPASTYGDVRRTSWNMSMSYKCLTNVLQMCCNLRSDVLSILTETCCAGDSSFTPMLSSTWKQIAN